jgi:phage-related baseplate assembly protein
MGETLPRWNLPDVDFVDADPEAVQAAMFSAYTAITGRTLAPGDPIRLFILTIAEIIIQQRAVINYTGRQNLLSYAQGEYLDALGKYLAVERLPAAHAITTIRLTLAATLEESYVIPAGFEVTNGVVTFATDRELVIPAGETTGEVSATCTTAGESGNGYLAGQLSTIVEPMPFLGTAINTTTTAGGSDIEDDADFADRIRLAPNSFSVAGPRKAYIFHTLSVNPGIVDVSVISPTPGVVNVLPLMEGGALPSAELRAEILDHLSADDIRPLTDDVHVLEPSTVSYTIRVDYWISRENAAKSASIQADVNAAVEKYRLWQQSKIGRDITPGQLIANVINAGAARIDSTTFTPSAFVELTAGQVAQCPPENVTINYKGMKDD